MTEESGHWYKRDGSPCYEVPAKGGGMRGVNLRYDRALGLVPSVTTVLSVAAKPALTNWMIDQAIMASLTLPRIDGESNDAWMARIREDAKQAAIKAADKGTAIHDGIERTLKTGTVVPEFQAHVEATLIELTRLFPDVNDWVSEKSFAHPLGYGGKVDLHSPSTGIVVDFKTKDGDFTELDAYGKPKKLAWDQNIQLAAYQVGLGLADKTETYNDGIREFDYGFRSFTPCANIFISRTHPGAVRSHVWPAEDVAKGWRIFQCALALWKEIKEYDASFEPEPETAF